MDNCLFSGLSIVIYCYDTQKREFSDIKLCDVFTILGLSLLSWVALIVDVVIYIFEKWDAVVLKRKEKKNETN